MPNQDVKVRVTIKNQGTCSAYPLDGDFIYVDFYKDRDSAPLRLSLSDGDICGAFNGILPSETVTLTGTIRYSSVGTFKMWAQVDRTQDVLEVSDDNNIFGPQTITVAAVPTSAILINGGATYTTTQDVTLDLPCASGCDHMSFYDANSPYAEWTPEEPYATSKTWTLGRGEGIKTLYVRYCGTSGNCSQYSDYIFLDLYAPTGAISINNGATYASTLSVTLNLSCEDSLGITCAGGRFSNDNILWTGWESLDFPSNTKAWRLASGDGPKSVYVQYQDNADRLSILASDSIILDTTPPEQKQVSINVGASYTNSTTVNLSLQASDSLSGITRMRIRNSDGAYGDWAEYATSYYNWQMASGEGVKTVLVQFMDAAGNVAEAQDNIILDTKPPQSGTLQATTTNQAVMLTWSGFEDDLSEIKCYSLYYSTRPITDASKAVKIYEGLELSYTHTDVSLTQAGYYRLFAMDNAGNISLGVAPSVNSGEFYIIPNKNGGATVIYLE
jgi:hypothetical protein